MLTHSTSVEVPGVGAVPPARHKLSLLAVGASFCAESTNASPPTCPAPIVTDAPVPLILATPNAPSVPSGLIGATSTLST